MTDKNITIESQELKRCMLLRLGGRLDGEASHDFDEAMQSALQAGYYNLVLNLSAVDYMSSASLRVLINTAKECRRFNRGDVRLAEISERVEQVLDLAGLDQLFQIFDTETEAVGSF